MVCQSIPEVAMEMGSRYLGNHLVCQLKAGMWASVPQYIGLSMAKVMHTQCEHRGDGVCKYDIDFSQCQPVGRTNVPLV